MSYEARAKKVLEMIRKQSRWADDAVDRAMDEDPDIDLSKRYFLMFFDGGIESSDDGWAAWKTVETLHDVASEIMELTGTEWWLGELVDLETGEVLRIDDYNISFSAQDKWDLDKQEEGHG